jgi:DNA-binding CsgD family transcriptional regulator
MLSLSDFEPFRSSWSDGSNRLLPLTAQESEILAASATGQTSEEVSERLGYSRKTVRECIATAIRKLGARSKLEAVIIALRYRLIDPP